MRRGLFLFQTRPTGRSRVEGVEYQDRHENKCKFRDRVPRREVGLGRYFPFWDSWYSIGWTSLLGLGLRSAVGFPRPFESGRGAVDWSSERDLATVVGRGYGDKPQTWFVKGW